MAVQNNNDHSARRFSSKQALAMILECNNSESENSNNTSESENSNNTSESEYTIDSASDGSYEENSIQTKRARQDLECPSQPTTVTVDSNVLTTYKWRDVSRSDDDSRKFDSTTIQLHLIVYILF